MRNQLNRTRAKQLMVECLDLMDKKNQDYGSRNIVKTGFGGVLVRLVDKAYRAFNQETTHNTPNFEGIRDTLRDIVNYALIALMVEEGSWDKITQPIKMVYLAGAVDAVIRSEALGWRIQAANALTKHNITCFDPAGAFHNGTLLTAGEIRTVNRKAIQTCDAVLVRLMKNVMVFGTVREIEFACQLGLPVIIWSDELVLKSLDTYDTAIYTSLDKAVNHLAKLNYTIEERVSLPNETPPSDNIPHINPPYPGWDKNLWGFMSREDRDE